jgi:hypothetical protein
MPLYKCLEFSILELIIVKHVIECIAELIRHLLDFELFTVNLVLNVINPEMKLKVSSLVRKLTARGQW